jgi:hypothetical protein
LKLVTGRAREAHWLIYVFALLFIARHAVLGSIEFDNDHSIELT